MTGDTELSQDIVSAVESALKRGINVREALALGRREESRKAERRAIENVTADLEDVYGELDEKKVRDAVFAAVDNFASAVKRWWYSPGMSLDVDDLERNIRLDMAIAPLFAEVKGKLAFGQKVRVEHRDGAAVYSLGTVNDFDTRRRATVLKVGKNALDPPSDFDVATASQQAVLRFVGDREAILEQLATKQATAQRHESVLE